MEIKFEEPGGHPEMAGIEAERMVQQRGVGSKHVRRAVGGEIVFDAEQETPVLPAQFRQALPDPETAPPELRAQRITSVQPFARPHRQFRPEHRFHALVDSFERRFGRFRRQIPVERRIQRPVGAERYTGGRQRFDLSGFARIMQLHTELPAVILRRLPALFQILQAGLAPKRGGSHLHSELLIRIHEQISNSRRSA